MAQERGKLGILGEFAGGSNSVCESAVTDLLTYLGENTDVWLGALCGEVDHGGVIISSAWSRRVALHK
jgi:hypothetical protein